MSELSFEKLLTSGFISGNAEAICILDRDQVILEWNFSMEKALGIDKDNALGREVQKVLPVFKTPILVKTLEKAYNGEGRLIDKSFIMGNHGKGFQLSTSPLDGPKNVRNVIVILRQVSNSNEHRLSRFKPLVEQSPIATAIYRSDGRPKYFNKAFGKLWGAESDLGAKVIDNYNVLQDEQLVDLGVMPFVEKAFGGETAEIPPIPYNPGNTERISHLGIDMNRFIKGHIFPIKDEEGLLDEVVVTLSDVTYQKQAEQILTETHLKFQMLALGLPGVIYEFEINPSKKNRFKYISQGCEEMFGVSPEAVMEDEDVLLRCIHPDDLAGFIESSKQSDKTLASWQWEGRINVNGEVKWIQGKSSPTKGKNSRIIRYGLLLDITEKKKVEHKYKLTEERLQMALEGAELGLWEWDTKKRKTMLNHGWAKKFGYPQNEIANKFDNWARLVHPEDLPGVKEAFYAHLQGETDVFEVEYRFLTKDGGYRWVLDKGRAIERNSKGKVTKAAGTYLDINEKKNSELLLKKNEQLFTQLFDNSPLGIVMLDERHQVIMMNEGFTNIFGFKKDEIVGNKLNDIIVPDELYQEAMDVNTLTSRGKVSMFESQRITKSGELIHVLIYGVPVSLNNTTIGIYGIYVDITDRKKAESELKIRNSELDHFVYKVSHDLRAPLSSILGLVHLASLEQNEDDMSEYISLIESRVHQLDSFINDVLSHSKNLKLAVTNKEIDFKSVVDNCFSDLNYLPHAALVNLELNITNKPFYSDRWRINEIFRNLISNAIKYLNTEISDPFVKITIDITDASALIRFEDNGMGIEEDTLPKVFEMFYRATEYSEGSGIGLYIVKNAIEKLGGEIGVESKAGEGTIFTFSIPNNKEEASE